MHTTKPLLILVALLAGAWMSPTSAGSLPKHELRCQGGSGAEIPVDERPWAGGDRAYQADLGSRRVIRLVGAESRIPDAAAKLDFAVACLQVLGQPADVCSAVRYLRAQNGLDRADVGNLERHYLERARRGDPSAYGTIKQVFSCY